MNARKARESMHKSPTTVRHSHMNQARSEEEEKEKQQRQVEKSRDKALG